MEDFLNSQKDTYINVEKKSFEIIKCEIQFRLH